MKVVCLDDFTVQLGAEGEYPAPCVGEKCTIIDKCTFLGYPCYELSEYPPSNGHRLLFDVEAFAPCSDIDERELLEERLTKEDVLLKALAEACPDLEMPVENDKRLWERINAHLNATL